MKFERIKYPDGQVSAKVVDTSINSSREDVHVRINSYEDLMYVGSIAEILKNKGFERKSLFIPCLFGQRSDRRFTEDQSYDLKVIANLINSFGFTNITIFHPHSQAATDLINSSKAIYPDVYVREILYDLIEKEHLENVTLVSPDAGAYKKTWEYGEKYNLPVLSAVKHRDTDGKIDLTFTGDVAGKTCLIVDDLCDGGYTFVTLGRKLKDAGAMNIYLYVSHGIFSKGFDELKKYIAHIYCTNSVKDIEDPYVTQFKII